MRSLPLLLRFAEEMTRMPRVSPFRTPQLAAINSLFSEPAWFVLEPRTAAANQIAEWQKNLKNGSPVQVGKNGYQVSIDVSEFRPSELTVKTVNNEVIVEGKAEREEDEHGGYMSRHFVHSFALPRGFEAENAISTLSSDGLLTVSVPNPKVNEASGERLIPIQQTGPAHLNVKENPPIVEEGPANTDEKPKTDIKSK